MDGDRRWWWGAGMGDGGRWREMEGDGRGWRGMEGDRGGWKGVEGVISAEGTEGDGAGRGDGRNGGE